MDLRLVCIEANGRNYSTSHQMTSLWIGQINPCWQQYNSEKVSFPYQEGLLLLRSSYWPSCGHGVIFALSKARCPLDTRQSKCPKALIAWLHTPPLLWGFDQCASGGGAYAVVESFHLDKDMGLTCIEADGRKYITSYRVRLPWIGQQILVDSNKIWKEMNFPYQRDSSYYQGVTTSPNVGMVLFTLFGKPDARLTLDDWNAQKSELAV